jgi:hypothetical protein
MLDVFSAEVIPLLQQRGLFRTAYVEETLRGHYGLAWPGRKAPSRRLRQKLSNNRIEPICICGYVVFMVCSATYPPRR